MNPDRSAARAIVIRGGGTIRKQEYALTCSGFLVELAWRDDVITVTLPGRKPWIFLLKLQATGSDDPFDPRSDLTWSANLEDLSAVLYARKSLVLVRSDGASYRFKTRRRKNFVRSATSSSPRRFPRSESRPLWRRHYGSLSRTAHIDRLKCCHRVDSVP